MATNPKSKRATLSVRTTIGVLFLLAQVVLIAQAQFLPTRWFCWAPNDYATEYEMSVLLDGRNLSPEEIMDRYKLPASAIRETRVEMLTTMIEQYERTYGKANPARVTLAYRFNGRPLQEWHWPSP